MKPCSVSAISAPALRCSFSLVLAAMFFLAVGPSSIAQQKDKKKKTDQPASNAKLDLPMSDEQRIDYTISEMLGAWQVGDTERLHKDYADDVSIVNGLWAPPVFGWTNYLAAYQAQRARMQQVRLDRENTFIKLNGNMAWASYQWDFSAVVDGQPTIARGQTTLIFEKRTDHWVIVHNHTSMAPSSEPVAPANTPQIAQPTRPPSH